MIEFEYSGNFNNIEEFFAKTNRTNYASIFEKYGKEGVLALASNTPVDTGLTQNSWGYEIHKTGDSIVITWTNSNIQDDVSIAVIIQYGHGTRNGGYVQGRDYINPALQPIFDQIANDIWKGVTNK